MIKIVVVIIGLLWEDLINCKLICVLEKLVEGKLSFVELNIGVLLYYNEDLWEIVFVEVFDLKVKVEVVDVVLVVILEYNCSFFGVIKNVLDWVSCFYGKNLWLGKLVVVIGILFGVIGVVVV